MRRFEPRDDERRRPAAHDREHRQAFEGHRAVAGQILEIRADPDEGCGHAPLRDQLREAAQPIRIAL